MQAFPKSRWCKQSVSSVERDLHPLTGDCVNGSTRSTKRKYLDTRYNTKWVEDSNFVHFAVCFSCTDIKMFKNVIWLFCRDSFKVTTLSCFPVSLRYSRNNLAALLLFFSVFTWIFFSLLFYLWFRPLCVIQNATLHVRSNVIPRDSR